MATSVDYRIFPPSLPPLTPAPHTSYIPATHLFSSDSDSDSDSDQPSYSLPAFSDPSSLDPRDAGTADCWIPRHPSLIRLTGNHPFNAEPPLPLLIRHGFITPSPLHYVRNHGAVPRASWSTWTIEVCGLVRRPTRLSMDSLVRDFPSFEIPVTLVCAGNRRKEQNAVRRTVGFNWGPAAISTSLWRGVRLRDVLRRCGVMKRREGVAYVCFEGADSLPGGGGGGYGTSLRREVAMDRSADVMLAYMQNGDVLSPDHGFPVRVVIPGYIGGRMVKWLKRIIVTAAESDSYYHYKDNRVLPSHVDAELADDGGWWYKPEYLINELNINSVITSPGHDDILPINTETTRVPCTLRGYAYSGGGKKVTRVEITLDGGESWHVCSVDHPEMPNKYGKHWCWCFWSLDVDLLHLLPAPYIAVRAWDETLNTQPQTLTWNLMGMMNNCWFRVRIAVCRALNGDLSLSFEHPTQPGNDQGGWMRPSSAGIEKTVSTTAPGASAANFSLAEVRRHSSPDSAWIVVHGHVYDCTAFLKAHPGGMDSILINAGSDCTDEFDSIHSDKAKSMLRSYLIGRLSDLPPASSAAAHRDKSVPVTLVAKTVISRNVRLFRFSLPSPERRIGLAPGKHVFLSTIINGKRCMRAYTPTSPEDAAGYFELIVRIYYEGEHPDYPAGGLMSQHLNSLPLGAGLEIKGPGGRIEYSGKGRFSVEGKVRRGKRVSMVAGGTGITPVYQVIRSALREEEGVEAIHLVYASRSEEDILMRKELDGWARERPERLKVWYVVSEARSEEWGYGVGRVTEEVLRNNILARVDEESLALVCGPAGMVETVVLPSLEKMGYQVGESCFVF